MHKENAQGTTGESYHVGEPFEKRAAVAEYLLHLTPAARAAAQEPDIRVAYSGGIITTLGGLEEFIRRKSATELSVREAAVLQDS